MKRNSLQELTMHVVVIQVKMRLFDIIAGSVTIHEDALAIPAFRKVWESDKDKKHATDVLSYIVLQNKWNSPYVTSIMDEEERAKRLKQ